MYSGKILFIFFALLANNFTVSQFTMSSDAALSSAPIITSIPADDQLFLDAAEGDVESVSSAGLGVAVIDDADAAIHIDPFDDMDPLPELPRQVIAAKRSHSSNSGASKSWVWAYFNKVDGNGSQINCLCTLCNKKVNYSSTRSTGTLARHIKRYHKSMWEEHLRQKTEVSLSSASGSTSTLSIEGFVKYCPRFEKCLVQWMIATYQPFRCVDDKHFREMCLSLNPKAPTLSREKLKTLVSEECFVAKVKVKKILKGRFFSFTTDGWTSLNHKGYVTCTAHFIDPNTWKLHAIVLGLYEKDGGSKHEDIVHYCEQQLTQFDLLYSNAIAVVTDTESTMIAAGRLFISNSEAQGGRTKWLGCIDHLVQLCTKIAFKDLPNSEGSMKLCRELVNFFNSSPQAMKKLHSKQVQGRELNPIQDVTTRWWSTYSMCERLIRLRPYLSLLENEGEVNFTNLSNSQWIIVEDLAALLKPFMILQKMLEGHAYVTISLVPYMIYKMRRGLVDAVNSAGSSEYVKTISSVMLNAFNKHFGNGAAGTVAFENSVEGQRRRPKGVSMLALMASFLDPRMKGGVGISPQDQDSIYLEIRNEMRLIAREGAAIERDVEVQERNDIDNVEQAARRNHDDMDIFDEIHQHYLDQQQLRNLEQADLNVRDDLVEDLIDAELTLYRQEPPIPMKDNSGSYNNPLSWWHLHERRFKHLSVLASRILCIPATSAPSERVFSTAGLTIAKDRARLASHTANELIFLHDVLPAIAKFEGAAGPG
jgi:hypothetical protein